MTSDLEATAPKGLRNRYAICGVGETPYMRGSKYSTRSLATWAIKNAMDDAGLTAAGIDGMLSYSGNDSTFSTFVAGDLGIRLNFYMDVHGGGSSTEALVGIATGVIEAGMCNTVAIFRAMNGYSQVRIGGTGARSAVPIVGDQIHMRAYGWQSAGQMFAPTFMRHLYDYGTTPAQVAAVKVAHSRHASNNPKAYYRKRYTVEDVLASRMICKPLHLLDCCVETDNATCIIVARTEHARDLRPRPALIRGVVGRCCRPRADSYYQHGPLATVAGHYAKDLLWPNAGLGPSEVDLTGSYDAFTFTAMLQLEDYGFCAKGEGGGVRIERHHRARRRPAQQHLRGPPLRGLHPRHEHGHRERPAVAGRGRRLVPDRDGRNPGAHLRLPGRGLPADARRGDQREPRVGNPRARVGDGSGTGLTTRLRDAAQGEYGARERGGATNAGTRRIPRDVSHDRRRGRREP